MKKVTHLLLQLGFSDSKLEITEEGFGKFHGNISLDVPKNNPQMTRSGYAGIRSKVLILLTSFPLPFSF